MKRYDKYKDSGEDWIGKIPEHWEIIKLKYLGSAIIGLTYSPNDLCNENEGTLVLRSSNLQNGKFVYGEKENSYVSSRIPQKLFIKKNDILICSRNGSRDLIGKCAIATISDEGNTFGAFTTVFRSKLNPYLFNILNSNIFKNLSGSFLTSTINQLTIGNLNSIYVPIPSHSEQQAIASFLDDKTSKIDQTISIKEKEIELLKERRQILIQKAVTKGLDDKVKLKDSGVEWIGEIPEHWEVRKLMGVCRFIRGNSPFGKDELLDEGEYVAIQYGKTYKVNEVNKEYGYYVNNEFYKKSQVVNYGDIILISTSETIDDLGHTVYYRRNDLGLLGGEQIMLKPKQEEINGQYLYFTSKVFSKELRKFATGIKVFRFNINDLKTIFTVLPPLSEQNEIANYIETKSTKISKAISLKQQEIEKLKEYKTVLIDNVVTGKVKVS